MSGMATGFAYCVVLALVLALAAHWLESALRSVNREGRWAWFAALALSLGVPLAAWLGLRTWAAPLPALPVGVMVLPELSVEAAPAGGYDWRPLLLGGWAVLSVLLAAKLAWSSARLRAARRRWPQQRVSGVDVLVTERLGPAVFGLRPPSILMPGWALAMGEDLRGLMVLHESEHVRAGDPWMLAGAILMVVLVPWNPAVWYQLHRLRLAVEMDCDARVLRRVPDPQRYGRLLLEVGRRPASPLGVLALSEPVSFLERRIRAFTMRAGPNTARKALALGAAAFCLGSLAVCARDPLSPAPEPAVDAVAVPSEAPTFTPYTVKPSLRNQAEVQKALQRNYPPLLRDAGIGGTAVLWFYIDEQGVVQRMQVHQSSGFDALDEAALSVAGIMEFSPALNRDELVPVWIQMPITFSSAASMETAEADQPTYSSERLDVTSAPAASGPHFTPYTMKPSLQNQAEVQMALQRNYPPLLRDAGIGGTTVLWFYIDDSGRVANVQVANGSGFEALDEAALQVAREMEFVPARNRAEAVDVWVQIPITFSSR